MSETPLDPSPEPITGTGDALLDADEHDDPIRLFEAWYARAHDEGIALPDAMALATADAHGAPSVRMVLLKGVDQRGFTFFTNYESRKADELEANPQAGLCFHWKELDRQVRITGPVERVSEEESREYFATRPLGSRIGAWASRQSRPLGSRQELEERVREIRGRYPGEDVPLPPFWGGYRVRPLRVEFWQGRNDRLHDRLVFERADHGWKASRLYP